MTDYGLLVPIALLGWFAAVVAYFPFAKPHRAVAGAFLAAWLFLPVATYQIRMLPDIDKASVTVLSVLIGAALFDGRRLLRFRPRWYDVPMALFCLVPIASSLSNGLGLYDGLSESLGQIFRWGLPYLIGRIYFTAPQALSDLIRGIFLGGLIYVPLCLYEIRMSPQLHKIVYGYHQHSFLQTLRYGGYRPMVFMDHGLMVGLFMTSATLVGFYLWTIRPRLRLMGVPIGFLVVTLMVTALLIKSVMAILLLGAGLVALLCLMLRPTRHLVVICVFLPVIYVGLRAGGAFSGETLVSGVETVLGAEKAESLDFRLRNENAMLDKAHARPLLGWGGWGRSRIVDAEGNDISVTDSQWIILMGRNGGLGVFLWLAALLLPALLFFRRLARVPGLARSPSAVAMLLVVLWVYDSLLNAMINPVFLLLAGGLAGQVPVRHMAKAKKSHFPVKRT